MPLNKLKTRERVACHKMKELKSFAKEKGIKPGKLRKAELVEAIVKKLPKKKKKIEESHVRA